MMPTLARSGRTVWKPALAAMLALALRLLVPEAAFAQTGAAPSGSANVPSGSAAPAGAPRLDADPRALLFAQAYDQADAQAGARDADNHTRDAGSTISGRDSPDWEVLLDAALWASGADDREAAALAAELRTALRIFLDDPKLPSDDAGRAEAVLDFIHRRFLKSYSELQTRLDTVLKTGRYNCVSSAVLYLVAGTAAGLEIRGVATADHAFCSVLAGDERKDVETTSPYGFDPGNRREFHDQFGRVTGFAYVSARDYRNRRSVGPLELISLILANRIVAAESAGRFAEAVGYAIDRRALLSRGGLSGNGGSSDDSGLFPDAERELLERLLNYGVSLAQRSREAEALAWADRAIDRFGSHIRWNDFIHSALNNLTIRLVQAGKYGEAYANLEAYSDRLETQVQRDLFRIVVEAELVKRVQGIASVQEAEVIFSALDDALAGQTLPAERVRELQVFVGLRMTEKIAKASGNRPALTYLDALPFNADRRIQDARKVYRSNIIAEFHNEFARLFNQRDYEKARTVIAQALAEFPQEKRLKDDLALLEKTAR